jgi:hypothetical protein
MWNLVRFGSALNSGLLGISTDLDNIIQNDGSCSPLSLYINEKNRTITREALISAYSCTSMNTMVEQILSLSSVRYNSFIN